MQRLYAMFPRKGPGYGLLFLRLSLVVSLLLALPLVGALLPSGWAHATLALVCVLLVLGLLTPLAVAAAFLGLGLASIGVNHPALWSVVPVMLTAASIFLLGPGAYSLDAHIYGRRVIELPDESD